MGLSLSNIGPRVRTDDTDPVDSRPVAKLRRQL